LLLIFGTSLQVQPFASLVRRPPEGTPRFLINRQKVGLNLGLDFDSADTTDGCFIGDCDAGAQRLATLLGWGDLGGTSRTISGDLGRISCDLGGPASASQIAAARTTPAAAPAAAPDAAPDAAPATNELAERLGAMSLSVTAVATHKEEGRLKVALSSTVATCASSSAAVRAAL
jgi:hypothetical protein